MSTPATDFRAYAVIMAGGKGERFWPLSTEKRPKQLLDLVGGKPLLLQAIERLEGLIPPERIVVVTNHSLVAAIREFLPPDSPVGVIGEPVGRDTAAAITAGAAWIRRRDPGAVFCVLTADHVIGDLPLFRDTLRACLARCAREDVLMTIGIRPTEPSSAYGYIALGEKVADDGGIEVFRAAAFKEKPTREVAERYLAEGRSLWNSGMFVWSLDAFSAALARHRPQLADCLARWGAAPSDDALLDALGRDFPGLEKISVDYALMEHADNILAARGTFAWDDVGSWPALESHLPLDPSGNAVRGDVVAENAHRNIVFGGDGRLVALVGVDDLVVVQTPGATLVCHKSHSQEIKGLLAQLRSQPGREPLL